MTEHIFRHPDGMTIVCTMEEFHQRWEKEGYEPLSYYLLREASKKGQTVEA